MAGSSVSTGRMPTMVHGTELLFLTEVKASNHEDGSNVSNARERLIHAPSFCRVAFAVSGWRRVMGRPGEQHRTRRPMARHLRRLQSANDGLQWRSAATTSCLPATSDRELRYEDVNWFACQRRAAAGGSSSQPRRQQ